MKSQNWWIVTRVHRSAPGPLLPPRHHREIDLVAAVVTDGIMHRHVARFAEGAEIQISPAFGVFGGGPANRHPLASDGAKSRTSNPDFGSKGTDTAPATRTFSGMCEAFSQSRTGKTAPLYFRSFHPEYKVETSSNTPASSALITTGRPSKVPTSRPAKISLGTYPCPACGSSSCRAEPTRHARRTGRCRWES